MKKKRGKIIRLFKAASEPSGDRDFIEVHRARDEAEALVVKGLFDSEGIPCVLRSRLVHSVHPFTVGDQGEIQILVHHSAVISARVLLARVAPGPSFP
ncbi:MAG TPA: DUF2007 domain-containing protein [Methylomirabilota bacterium]|nr:DUF2007 domain-containing protein [Methylomirabilota bacterium]